MIQTLDNLRSAVDSKIKVIQNNTPEKTQAADVKQLLTDILDTLNDLVEKQGLSLSNNISSSITQVTQSLTQYVKTNQLPDLSVYQKVADNIPYSRLTNTPVIPTYDLSPYQLISNSFNGSYSNLTNKPDFTVYALKTQLPDLTVYALKTDVPAGQDLSSYQLKTDNLAYSRLTGVPAVDYNSLLNKPNLFDGSWTNLTAKPTLVTSYSQLSNLPTLFNGDYTSLINKPTIPTYDLSLYKLKTDTVDYTTLVNKPNIISDYTQLTNKPNSSKLLWNQLSNTSVINTVTETNVLVNGSGVLNIEANPIIGTAYRVNGRGVFSLQTLTSPTLNIKLYAGNTLLASGTSSSLLLGASNKTFSFGVDIMIPAANTIYAQGFFAYYAGITDALSSTPIVNGNGVNSIVDLSAVNQLKLTFTWSIANSSNLIMTKIVNFEKLNNN